jgi:predicted transcriptional regulator
MSQETDVGDELDLVAKRSDILELLDGERLPKRTIADELGYSRSTVNRAVAALSDAGLVDDAPSGCRTTFVGSLLAAQYDEYVNAATNVLRGREVLTSLPPDADLPPSVLADAEVSTPGGSSPYEPYHAIEALLERAVGQVRMYVPTFSNPRGVELARTLSERLAVEIVFDGELLAQLRSDVPEEVETLFALEGFTGYETATGPEYTLVVVDTDSGMEGAVVIHSTERELVGCLVTRDHDATQWMHGRYAEIRAESERLDTFP